MIKHIAILLLTLCVAAVNKTIAQSQTEFGYVNLKIRYTGEITQDVAPTFVSYGNVLRNETQTEFNKINDSTYFFNEISIGPTGISFRILGNYFSTILYPNEIDSVVINLDNDTLKSTTYYGKSKDIFDSSNIPMSILQSLFSTSNSRKKTLYNVPLQKAEDLIAIEEQSMNDYLSPFLSTCQSASLKKHYTNVIQAYFVTLPLWQNYESRAYAYNIHLGLDTVSAKKQIPNRDERYKEVVMRKMIVEAENAKNPIGTTEVIDGVLNDKNLDILNREMHTAEQVFKRCEEFAKNINIPEKNKWLEILTAKALIKQINKGNELSDTDKLYLANFENKGLLNYIRTIDIITKKEKVATDIQHYMFPYSKEKTKVLEDIVSRFPGKVVVVDFWATWCGPCIEAFGQMKGIKEKYADNSDIVFVYITDETSNKESWKHFVKSIDGAHYYIYTSQSGEIYNKYGIKAIPSYLIFDKSGNLAEQALNGFPGVEEFTKKIESSLGK